MKRCRISRGDGEKGIFFFFLAYFAWGLGGS